MTQIKRIIMVYFVKRAAFIGFSLYKQSFALLGLITMILISCNYSKIRSIDLLFVHWSTTSSATVHCDLFEWAFKVILKEERVSDRKFLNEFKVLIKDLEIDDDSSAINDARIKCLIHYRNHTDTLCISLGNRIFLNGQLMKEDQKLTDFIDKLIGWE